MSSKHLIAQLFPAPDSPVEEVRTPRTCYVCKKDYTRLHHFYDGMCPACADLNYAKRFQTADLTGRTALITGARLKIGVEHPGYPNEVVAPADVARTLAADLD